MKTVRISLNSIDKVKSFVNDITRFDNDFDLVSGRYVIDAKSIMGIFSLDLSKPKMCIRDREKHEKFIVNTAGRIGSQSASLTPVSYTHLYSSQPPSRFPASSPRTSRPAGSPARGHSRSSDG